MKRSAAIANLIVACMCLAQPSFAVALTTELVASGFNTPVFLTSPPNDIERMFIVEQRTGKIRIIKNGVVLPTPFLDVLPLITIAGEQGLLGLAFHPRYERNGFFYINYTDLNGDTRVVRYKVSSNPDIADPNSAFEILFVDQPFANHNGGMLAFGPDGYLYIGMGDGGGAPGTRPQNLATDLGKMLRIRPRKNQQYTIPPDNPFVSTPGASPRIYLR
ncbi:MAG: PQQ-dependent sugar dehydrogenase, partial [Candidatus Hydrogenedentes bacterium]|nr:PQQ-dependent sugar dehydrogenase [Candidatus Hydrogenedentota bacterium]